MCPRGAQDLTLVDFFMWTSVKNYFSSVWIQSITHVKEDFEQANEAVSTKISKTLCNI